MTTPVEQQSERRPSEVTDEGWLRARRQSGDYPGPTEDCGKWLIFAPREELDELWAHIKPATEEGRLGFAAKVSTAHPGHIARSTDGGVICVYTYDWTDERDARRVRQELRDLGVTKKIPYKSDKDTLAGKYAVRRQGRISKYFE